MSPRRWEGFGVGVARRLFVSEPLVAWGRGQDQRRAGPLLDCDGCAPRSSQQEELRPACGRTPGWRGQPDRRRAPPAAEGAASRPPRSGRPDRERPDRPAPPDALTSGTAGGARVITACASREDVGGRAGCSAPAPVRRHPAAGSWSFRCGATASSPRIPKSMITGSRGSQDDVRGLQVGQGEHRPGESAATPQQRPRQSRCASPSKWP